MKVVVIDTEGVGIADRATHLHILGWTYDGKTVEHTFDNDLMSEQLLFWVREDYRIVCHNAIGHDLKVFYNVLGLKLPYTSFVDSLYLSWVINHDRNSHGLGSYGDDFGVPKPDVEFWERQEGQTQEEFLEIMRNRVTEDVKINWKLWKQLEKKLMELYN